MAEGDGGGAGDDAVGGGGAAEAVGAAETVETVGAAEAAGAARERPSTIVLDRADNVAVALRAIEAGEEVQVAGAPLRAADAIPSGHKLARRAIGKGEEVRKYAETIGIASAPIAAGAHVHVQNVRSARLPGR